MTATAEQAMEDMQDEAETRERLLENLTRRNVATLSWISSLVSRQADTLPDELSAELARLSLSRIQAFTNLEHALHYRDDRILADLRSFTDECTAFLCSARSGQSNVTTINEVAATLVDAEHAARLATVIYELLANALEHGFEGREYGNYVRVALGFEATDDPDTVRATITVEDNGIGMPAGDALASYETTGFTLINDVVNYYQGQFAQRSVSSGTSLYVSLELPQEAVN